MNKIKAFTLMEMMVVLTIFSVVMGVAFTTIRLNETFRDLVLIRIELYRHNKVAAENMRMELQRSTAGRINIQDNTTPNTDAIWFQIPLLNSIDNQYNIPWGARKGNTDYPNYFIRYRLNGTDFMREVLDNTLSPVANTQELITENIVDLQFTRPSPTYFTWSITGQKTTLQGRTINATLQATVYVRN